MNTSLSVRGSNINVYLKLHATGIFINSELTKLLAEDAETATYELILCIKAEYLKLFSTELEISNASMAVEIWAHVYAEKFAKAAKEHSSINFVDTIADIIIHHAEVIDIGEKGYDYNRFVWDGLAVFKSAIAGFLFSSENE